MLYAQTKTYHYVTCPQQSSLPKVNIERVNCRRHSRGSTTKAEVIFKTMPLDEIEA